MGSVDSHTVVVSESKRSERMVLFQFWTERNVPHSTCILVIGGTLKHRRSGSSAALIDEPGSDGHRTPEFSLVIGVEILNALSAKLNEELGISSDITRGR